MRNHEDARSTTKRRAARRGRFRGRLTAGSAAVAYALVVGCSKPTAPEPAVAEAPRATATALVSAAASAVPGGPACAKELVVDVAGTTVWRLPTKSVIAFKAGMVIDADGAPKAYHSDDGKALDVLSNAGRDGAWASLVTDTGKPDGKPLVQGRADPAPGYFVSATALFNKNKPTKSPTRYVDASVVSYVALPPESKEWGAKLGDFAVVLNAKSGRMAYAIFADLAPPAKLGEGSIALADAVGIATSPKEGGIPFGVIYAVFTGSGNGSPRTPAEIDAEGKKLLDAMGGRTSLAVCFR